MMNNNAHMRTACYAIHVKRQLVHTSDIIGLESLEYIVFN